MADVIFTPVFEGTSYLHHVCSECQHKIYLDQSVFGDVYFGDHSDIKFCPHCGNPVVRFSNKPVFVTELDFEPLTPFWSLRNEYERKCRWLYFHHISEERQKKVVDLLPFAEKAGGWVAIAAEAVRIGKRYSTDGRQIRKLIKEFGAEREG